MFRGQKVNTDFFPSLLQSAASKATREKKKFPIIIVRICLFSFETWHDHIAWSLCEVFSIAPSNKLTAKNENSADPFPHHNVQSIVKHILNKQQFSSILIVLQLWRCVNCENGKMQCIKKGQEKLAAQRVFLEYRISNDHVKLCLKYFVNKGMIGISWEYFKGFAMIKFDYSANYGFKVL